jgi:hypothetical protein
MTPIQREALLATLAQQQDATAPVTVQIGAVVNQQVQHDCIRVLEAPSSVIESVFEWTKRERNNNEPYVQAFLSDGALVIR